MKRDYLNGTDYTILQKEGMYHFNSDTELLGRFINVRRDDTVLDIGCASGALMLYATKYHPRSVTGIDLFEEVIQSAAENMAYNQFSAQLICARVQDLKKGKYSLILCNPPYFETVNEDLVSKNPYLAAARHEKYLTPDELFEAVKRLLADQGRFMMVHRASRIHEIFDTASKYGMRCVRMKLAYESQGKQAKSAAMEFRMSTRAEMRIEPPAYLDNRETFDERGIMQ